MSRQEEKEIANYVLDLFRRYRNGETYVLKGEGPVAGATLLIAQSSNRLEKLNKVLIGLTVILAILTAVLLGRTFI